MKKKLIISERQYNKLNKFINEDNNYNNMVSEIIDHLEMNYKKAIENYRDGNEYKTRKVFEIKADGDLISPKDLANYIKSKFSVGETFVKQLLDDWCNNAIKDGKLSKNVELSK
jgi:hypothetical protein